MTSYSWAAPVSSDWANAALWSPAAVPNNAAADVTIDNPTLAAYLVTIAAGENETVDSVSMNATNDLQGSNKAPYVAAEMELSGTLTFAPGSAGLFGGSLQTFLSMINGTMINPGTVDAFIQAKGNVLFTGTNGFYVTNWLQSVGGTVTVDTKSIAEMTGNTLFDGIFEAQGDGAIINLGGPRQDLIVNIQTIEGPPLIPAGWTELILNGAVNDIGEWNGSTYVGIESTLTDIASRGTFDIIGGRNYATANTLSISSGGLLNLSAGIVTTGLLNINGGTVQGSGYINSGVINNGTLRALDGTLTVGTGGLVGTGLVSFDFDQKYGTVAATGGVMEVHGVGPGQTFVMNGDDTLVLDTPSSFAGTIEAKAGDHVLLGGVSATSATLIGNTLVLQSGATTVDALSMAGSYIGDTFAVVALPGGSSEIEIRPAAVAATVQDATTGTTSTAGLQSYTGTIPGLLSQYINITSDSLNVTATSPNEFISTGSGTDSINVSGVNGNNVLDGGGGSDFLTGGTGDDTFYLNVGSQTVPTYSTVANFHLGDNLTIFGVSLSDFSVSLSNDVGAPGYTGLEFSFSQAGHPIANVILAGYSTADLTNGSLSQAFGTTPSVGGVPGTPYLTIHGT